MSPRIRSLSADRIGPLRRFRLEPADVTVIEGDNEAGKSSIVDALDAWLRERFRRANAISWERTRRGVPGYDGEVEVRLEAEGDEAALPELLREHPLLLNLLVIPEGAASRRAVGAGGRDWVDAARRHLAGFDPEPLRAKIAERAGLTPTGRDSAGWSAEARRLRDERETIRAFLRSLDGLTSQEAELRRRRAERARLSRDADAERAAVRFDLYRRARAALHDLERSRETLAALARHDPGDLERWRDLERQRAAATARVDVARETLEVARRDLEHADSARRRAEAEARDASGLRDTLAGSGVAGRAEDVASRLRAAGHRAEVAARWRAPAGILALIGIAASLSRVVLDQAPGAVFVAGAAWLAAAAIWLWGERASSRLAATRTKASAVMRDARTAGLDPEQIGDVVRAAAAAGERAARARARLEGAREEVERRTGRVEEHAAAVRARERELHEVRDEIGLLRDRTGLGQVAELEAGVRRRIEAEDAARRAQAELDRQFPGLDAERRAEAIAAAETDDPGRVPVPGRLDELEARLHETRGQVRRLEQATESVLREGLARIGCPDLAGARDRLEAIERRDDERRVDREAAELALAALREAAEDLEGHLDRALDGASTIFRRLTEGRWTGLRQAEDGLEVLDAAGAAVPVAALSRGTQDQLHVALRAAMAERVLGAPAFFVWDDTFLTADPDRRGTLVDTALQLADRGWQIVYLTVDPTIADRFERAAAARTDVTFLRRRLQPPADRQRGVRRRLRRQAFPEAGRRT